MTSQSVRINIYLLMWTAVFFLASPGVPAVITVPGEASTLQAGIIAAAAGDTVLVAPGTYSGAGNTGVDFLGKGILLISEAGPDHTILLAIDSGRTVRFTGGEDSTAVLDGFTISGGYEYDFSWAESDFRGGIYIEYASPIIRNCIIRGCFNDDGGGFLFHGGHPRMEDCLIIDNRAAHRGGGGVADCDSLQLIDCHIAENEIRCPFSFWLAAGGGIYNTGGITIEGSYIGHNRVRHAAAPPAANAPLLAQGGGMYSLGGTVTVDSCRIVHNSAGVAGGLLTGLGLTAVKRSLIYNNTAVVHAGMVQLTATGPGFGGADITGCTFACNYGAEIQTDGIAFVGNPTQLAAYLQETDANAVITPKTSADPIDGQNRVIGCIFAFNASSAIAADDETLALEVSHTNVWHTVSGPDYGDFPGDQTGSNGNISTDPLFCDISDTGFTVDAASPCLGVGPTGDDIGAFGVGCDAFTGRLPQRYDVSLSDSTAENQALIDAILSEALPWDSLALHADRVRVDIDSLVIRKPLYIIGPGLSSDSSFVLSQVFGYSNRAVIRLRSFGIVDRLDIDAYDSPNEIQGFTAVTGSDYPSIITLGRLAAHDANPALAAFNCSPLLRTSQVYNGISAFGTGDIVASYNYWGCEEISCIQEILAIDTLFYSGTVLFAPFEQQIPTSVEDDFTDPSRPMPIVSQNYPNPFNAGTVISFFLPRATRVELHIYDILGRLVASPLSSTLTAGEHSYAWSGVDDDGQSLPSGVYLYRLTTETITGARKMVILK